MTRPSLGWRTLLLPGLVSVIALAILIGLGIWQLERKAWKEGLLAQIQARAYGPPGTPVPESDWPRWDRTEDEFRRVTLEGRFANDLAVSIHGLAELRGAAVPGVYVFTPLQLPEGGIVVVNRGFVPMGSGDLAARPDAPTGPVKVTGLVRAPEARPAFVPANEPGREQWYVRDLAEISRVRGLSRVAPFYIDADDTANAGGWPLGGRTRLTLANDHLQYALTWFGLALTLVGVVGALAWSRFRAPADTPSDIAVARTKEMSGRREAGQT